MYSRHHYVISVSCEENIAQIIGKSNEAKISTSTHCKNTEIKSNQLRELNWHWIYLKSLEIVWKDTRNDKTDTLYVAFRNETERNLFYDRTMAQDGVSIAKIKPETMTLKWQSGAISNYEYLLYLNR